MGGLEQGGEGVSLDVLQQSSKIISAVLYRFYNRQGKPHGLEKAGLILVT